MRAAGIRGLAIVSLAIISAFVACGKKTNEADAMKAKIAELDPIKDYGWLVGTWARAYGHNFTYETWEKAPDGSLAGEGYMVSGFDTTYTEHLKIVKTDSGMFYVADVSQNQTPTYFELTSYRGDTSTFENPEHDFPSRIIYAPIGEDSLFARIEGERKGKVTGVDFLFKRIN